VSEHFEVQRTIPVDAATIFGVLCSPQGHVAIDASGMLQSYTGEPASAVGFFMGANVVRRRGIEQNRHRI